LQQYLQQEFRDGKKTRRLQIFWNTYAYGYDLTQQPLLTKHRGGE
jgi:hypothetical protein